MKKSKKLAGTGRIKAVLVSATLLVAVGLVAPAVSFAQTDAAPVAATTESETTPAPQPEPAPAPSGDVVTPAPEAPPVESGMDPVAAKTGLQNLSEAVLEIVIPTLVTAIGGLITMFFLWVRKKYKLDISDKSIDSWSKLAKKGANRGGEWARNKTKELVKGKRVPGPEVLDVGVSWAIEAGRAAGLPEMGREVLEGWVEGHLFENRDDEEQPVEQPDEEEA